MAVVGKYSLAEKARRSGTPSQLHLWWARRPLAACRAILLALLLPDPCHSLCPTEFKQAAWAALERLGIRGESDTDLRQGLLKFIGTFANWDVAAAITYLEAARTLVVAAHGEEPPLVVDPF